mgnify:CR=1 FL=1
MKPFLKQLVETVKSEHQYIGKVTMVVPTQRSGVYIKKYLIESATETSWAPTIITIDDFIKANCKLNSIDSIELLFLFYELYVEIEKENADSFFYFSKWAPTLLADFNEMDHYMVNPITIFNDLRNIKEIDNWSFNEEELSDLQTNFTVFWEKLPTYYNRLNDKLTELEKGYSGKLYKWVATSIYEVLDDYEPKTVYFAGFNALSTSEELIIETFVNSGKGQLMLDGDEFYIDNPDHEAGHFLRQQIAKKGRKSLKWIDSYFPKNEKKIDILSSQSEVMMAKATGEILSNLSEEEIKKTALVLADEKLLLPVINSIPESIETYNISLGYALSNSPIFSLLNSIFSIQESFVKHNKSSLHYKSFMGIVEHYLMKKVVNSYHIKQEIVSKNITFISSKFIKEKEELKGLEFVFTKWNEETLLSDAFTAFDTLISMIVESMSFATNSMELEYLFSAQKVIRKVENKLTQKEYIKDLKTLKYLFFQLFKSENVSFIGEPLTGLQVIGMLETRALDFDNIILLSVNEDVLPKGNTGNSFFPYELKRLYKLPTYKEKEAIYANHFYRLLQRSSKVSLLYNNSTSGFGAREKSRYIEQLKEELKPFENITITEKVITSEISKTSKTNQEIKKDKKVLENLYSLAEYGFSPSALIKFKACPLDFYYTYVVGLREEEEVEEDIEANTFGNIVHKVLEELYKPYKNKVLIEQDINLMLSKVDDYLTQYFKEEYSSHFDSGKNYLMYNGAKKTITAFLKQELKVVKDNELIIKGLERKEVVDFEVEIEGKMLKTKLRGTIDRIDELNQTKRIIDYKTGKVSSTDLGLKNIENVTSNKAMKDKAFQLLFYDLLLEPELIENQEITAGIISTKAISSGLFPLNLKSAPNNYPETEDREEFKELVQSIIQEIFDTTAPFVHNEDAKYCKYCE